MSLSGTQLYRIVEEFAALGDHQTGSDVDASTVTWLSERLRALGLAVTIDRQPFDRWQGTLDLRVGGDPVDGLAVPYEWTGTIETDLVDVAGFDAMSGGFPAALDAPIAAAVARGAEVAVLATEHPDGSLVGVNRILGVERPGVPTVLVAGRDLDRLRSGAVTVAMTGSIVAGETANLVADTAVGASASPEERIIVTTPLTGWFSCAGERGTGVAVLLDLVERFAHLPLRVVATGGHELGFFGAHRWVDANPGPVRAIVHVGASVAVDAPDDDGTRELVPTRFAMTSLDDAAAAPVVAALEPVGLGLGTATERWIGEGEAWSRLGVPLLSSTGAGIDFHTPEDQPERVTSPASLALVAAAFADATAALLEAVPPAPDGAEASSRTQESSSS